MPFAAIGPDARHFVDNPAAMERKNHQDPDINAAVSVIIVTFNNADCIAQTLQAVTSELRTGDELIVVDNGSTDATAAIVRDRFGAAHLVEQGNVGFAGGCNAGAAIAHGDLLLLLNPDALLLPGALSALRERAHTRPGWHAWQPLIELADGMHINTAGGVVHFTGIGWAGGCDDPLADAPSDDRAVAFASGAALVVRRSAWNELGGMPDRFFMYAEDLELGLRVWLGGGQVGVVPEARVRHDYEFTKGAYKWRMLERNRAATVLTVWPAGLLLAVMPALLLTELALLAVAVRGGWLGAKLRAWGDVVRWLPWIARRRRIVQGARAVSAATFASLLTARLDSPYTALPKPIAIPVGAGLRAYWRLARTLTGRAATMLLDNPR